MTAAAATGAAASRSVRPSVRACVGVASSVEKSTQPTSCSHRTPRHVSPTRRRRPAGYFVIHLSVWPCLTPVPSLAAPAAAAAALAAAVVSKGEQSGPDRDKCVKLATRRLLEVDRRCRCRSFRSNMKARESRRHISQRIFKK